MPHFPSAVVVGVCCSVLLLAHAQPLEQRSGSADQRAVAVTIYNENLALVKDVRTVSLAKGPVALAFRDVSAGLRPETALLRSLTAAGAVRVHEQNFDFDLLTPQKLLEKYVGRQVKVVRTHVATGQETAEAATVLSASDGVVLQMGDRIETGVPGRLVFGDVPPNLRDRPTLVMSLENTGAVQQELELSYLTAGLSWQADYVVELAAADDALDMSGWVTLTNTSGATYRNATLQLVAGDVNQVAPDIRILGGPVRMAASALAKADTRMAEEGLLEYHLYTLARPTTLAENQTKQVALLSASGVSARKELVFQGGGDGYNGATAEGTQKPPVGVFLEFANRQGAGLGLPLPKGVVRVYKKDSAGHAQFIGEDRMDHTPTNEKIRLKLGHAFDVTADKKQTAFKRLPQSGTSGVVAESAYEIVLKNAKKEAVTVRVVEPIPGDWQIQASNLPHTRPSAGTAVWQVIIPAQGTSVLTFRVLVRY